VDKILEMDFEEAKLHETETLEALLSLQGGSHGDKLKNLSPADVERAVNRL